MSDEKAEIERLAVLAEASEGDRALLPETYRRIVAFTLRHSAELAALRSEVERLTRERDEARRRECSALCRDVEAERDSLSSKLNAMIQLCDQKAAERDEALEACALATANLPMVEAKMAEWQTTTNLLLNYLNTALGRPADSPRVPLAELIRALIDERDSLSSQLAEVRAKLTKEDV